MSAPALQLSGVVLPEGEHRDRPDALALGGQRVGLRGRDRAREVAAGHLGAAEHELEDAETRARAEEIADQSRKFWAGVAFSVPLLAIFVFAASMAISALLNCVPIINKHFV